MEKIKKWYFATNSSGLTNRADQIKVAVRSCQKHTKLQPYCLYSGRDNEQRRFLTDLGVHVINHEPSFSDALRVGYKDKYDTFLGHWLRVDIPLIEREDAYIIYTDTDIMFVNNIENLIDAQYISAGPEFNKDDYSYFNSGVMIMNVGNLRVIHDEFIESIRSRFEKDFTYPAHDQESYNRFFVGKFDRLPPEYNWKPYWGKSENARIIHFHGPKQAAIKAMESGNFNNISPGHQRLWRKNPEAYTYYNSIFNKYLP